MHHRNDNGFTQQFKCARLIKRSRLLGCGQVAEDSVMLLPVAKGTFKLFCKDSHVPRESFLLPFEMYFPSPAACMHSLLFSMLHARRESAQHAGVVFEYQRAGNT